MTQEELARIWAASYTQYYVEFLPSLVQRFDPAVNVNLRLYSSEQIGEFQTSEIGNLKERAAKHADEVVEMVAERFPGN